MGRVTSVNPPSWPPTFPFFACCPTGHLPIHLGPVLLITRLGLRMRTNVPPFGDVLCPEKGYQYTRAFFHAFSLSLSPPSRVLSLSLSVCVFFTLVATKGPLSVARRARLFYTPNVIQPRSYLKLFLSLSLSLSVSLPVAVYTPLFIHGRCFSFVLKCFWNRDATRSRWTRATKKVVGRGRRAVVGTTKKNCISPLIPSPVERLGRERIKNRGSA